MHNASIGTFSELGPATYLTEDPTECRALLQGAKPPRSTWFHGTTEQVARQVSIHGLIPGCWLGDGCCAVMGYSSQADFLLRVSHLWIVEVDSHALNGDIKAWWVPPDSIVGAWFHGIFYPKAELALDPDPEPPYVDGCSCGLSDLCREQQRAWRTHISGHG